MMSKYTKDTRPCEVEECKCHECPKKDQCPHNGAFRRLPTALGGLGLCPNLKGE